jgi:hypothetical protein
MRGPIAGKPRRNLIQARETLENKRGKAHQEAPGIYRRRTSAEIHASANPRAVTAVTELRPAGW